jgi:hypothetical protein
LRRCMSPQLADIVAKRFLVLERRTVFSRLDRIGYFDSQNRPFGFYYCRISPAGPFIGDFCNKIDHGLPLRLRRRHDRSTPDSRRLAATPKSAESGEQETFWPLSRLHEKLGVTFQS